MKGRLMKLRAILIALSLAGCAADQPLGSMGHREAGTLLGAVGGAVIGAVAYDRNRTKGAVVGAVGGALAGGAVGRYMDDQKRDLEKNLATEIKTGQARVEKLGNDVVRITMTSQTAFETNSADIKSGFHSTMDKVAEVVVRYGKTTLTVVGHTDDVGSNAYNQSLSERRALSVAQYLESRRVDSMRLATAGKGETQPRSSNSTETGRQENRRVEIYLEPVTQG
jgi:outer membrane protein OmpA-like peptidoglycan-associated protein